MNGPQNWHVDPDISVAQTLPGTFFHDAELFERAKNQIFARRWHFIGDDDDLRAPGTVKPITLLDGYMNEPLVLTRDTEDQLHLLSNVCTHRGMLVSEGISNERFLRCRYHGRRWGLDGKFQHMPEFEGVANFPCEKDHLSPVPFGRWGKLLFASIWPGMSLDEVLAPVKARLDWLPLNEFHFRPDRSRDYLVRCHWALYVENYLEGLHIPFIHADLNAVLDFKNYTTELFEHGNLQVGRAMNGEGTFDLPAHSPDFGESISAYYFWLFPNLMLNFYPWGLSVNVVQPLQPDLTRVRFLCYVWKESKLGEGAGAALDRVEREDEVVVELVQKGLHSRFYDRGRFSASMEQGPHHFQRLLAENLANRP